MRRDAETCVRFAAVLGKDTRTLGWTIASVPFDPRAVWPHMLRLRVRGGVNGFPFRTSLFAEAAPKHGYYLLINRAMQAGAGVRLGQQASFVLEPDLEPREATLPDELDALLDEADGLRAWYEALTEYTRREMAKWVDGVKTQASREHRAQQMAERLLATMDAEIELPPAIAQALARRPKAQAGWAKLTAAQRRGELLAVFSYQSPESRDRRIAKLCDAAEKRAG